MGRVQIISWHATHTDVRTAIADVEDLVNTEIEKGVLHDVDVRDIRAQTLYTAGAFTHIISVVFVFVERTDEEQP